MKANMTIELAQEHTQKRQQFWSINQIYLAAAFGGLVAGCYFLGRNYRLLGRPREAKISYLLGIFGTLLLILLASFIPDEFFDRIPGWFFAVLCGSTIGSIASYYQAAAIKDKISQGEKRYSYWWCVLMIFTINVIQTPIFFALSFLLGWMTA